MWYSMGKTSVKNIDMHERVLEAKRNKKVVIEGIFKHINNQK